jgi:hypothetical protein
MYFFRGVSIVSAISALITVVIWIADEVTDTNFSQPR